MKRILLGLGGVLILLFAGIAISAYLIPSSVYKSRIELAASGALARDVALNGDLSLSVFPRISAKVEDVVIANPEGFGDEPFATAHSLSASVAWLPLLARRVEVDTLTFDGGDIKLVRLANGRANWEIPASETETPEATEGDSGGSFDASVGKARLTNSSVYYSDAVSGQSYSVEEIDVEARLRALDQPFDMTGSARVNGEAFKFDVDLASIEGLTGGETTDVRADITSDLVNVLYEGSLLLADTPAVNGRLVANASDIRKLTDAFSAELPEGDDTFQSFAIDAGLKSAGKGYELVLNKAEFDELSATGTATADLSGNTPRVNATLNTSKLDLTPYLGSGEAPAQQPSNTQTGWSKDPINLGVLSAVNGQFALTSPEIIVNNMTLRDVDLSSTLNNGKMDLTINKAQSFQGALKGVLTVVGKDAPGKSEIRTDFTGSEVSAGEVVSAFLGRDIIRGMGVVTIDNINMRGASLDEMMRNLNGEMTVGLTDGALKGVNLAQLYRTAGDFLKTGQVPTAFSPEKETDFSSFTFASTVNNGVADLQRIVLQGAGIRMEADGSVDIANQTFRIRPKLTSTTENALKVNVGGLSIPVSDLPWQIGGPWTSPTIGLDENALQTLVQNRLRSELNNQINNQIMNQVDENSPLGAILGNIIGGGSRQTTTPTEINTESGEADETVSEEQEEKSEEEIIKDALTDFLQPKKKNN